MSVHVSMCVTFRNITTKISDVEIVATNTVHIVRCSLMSAMLDRCVTVHALTKVRNCLNPWRYACSCCP